MAATGQTICVFQPEEWINIQSTQKNLSNQQLTGEKKKKKKDKRANILNKPKWFRKLDTKLIKDITLKF